MIPISETLHSALEKLSRNKSLTRIFLKKFFLLAALLPLPARAAFIETLRQHGVEIQVHAPLIAFRYGKSEDKPLWGRIVYLNGTINRLAIWHRPSEIFDFMSRFYEIEKKPLTVNPSLSLEDTAYYELAKKDEKKILYCTQAKKKERIFFLFLDFCFLPVAYEHKDSILMAFLEAFAKEDRWPKVFTQNVAVFDDTSDLKLAPLWLTVMRSQSRSYFTDTAGLAQIEIYRESIKEYEKSEQARRLWEKTIAEKMSPNELSKQKREHLVSCLLFKKEERYLSLCYTFRALERIAFVASFPEKLYAPEDFQNYQIQVLGEWARE
ncbi:MAG: hypothetical protein NZM25_05775 [Leptospiraceae bacterium]|nr:hypothetical protein [Leptospiraceae bacterium]MDW8306716.1 hypothetical protein [Leptospiraceae bacterium]